MGLLEMMEEDDAATGAPTPPNPIPGPPTPRGWWSPWQLNGGMPSNAAGYIGTVSGNAFVFQSDYVVGCSIPDPSQAGCLVVRNRGTNNLRIRADGMVICTIIPGSYCAYPLNVGQRHLEAYIVDDRAYVADRLLATSDPNIQSQGHEWRLMDQ